MDTQAAKGIGVKICSEGNPGFLDGAGEGNIEGGVDIRCYGGTEDIRNVGGVDNCR